jgi:hypothetical protein
MILYIYDICFFKARPSLNIYIYAEKSRHHLPDYASNTKDAQYYVIAHDS